MSTPARVRFAPSPTGFLHVGGVRTALFNWLLARKTGGSFVLRLEDTDQSRLVEGAFEQIEASLAVLGLTPDEGPIQGGNFGSYIQSERLDRYKAYSDELVEKGSLYPCWCSPERLTKLREDAQAQGSAFKYDRYCLANPKSNDESHVLRFRIPETPTSISWDDAVRGHNEVNLKELDDFVAIKSDGFPTYQFANVPDDHDMEITHVLRADEWLPSTPKHLLLFAAFGWTPPIYAHLPSILGPDGQKKLSKRDAAVDVNDYISQGYLPEAIISFLATLGWNDGTTKEIFSIEELIAAFSLERIQKSPAKFDIDRLTWMNGYIIRNMPPAELLKRSEGFWPADAADQDSEYRLEVLELVQERLKFLSELPELTDFFFTEPDPSPLLLTKTMNAPVAAKHLSAINKILSKTEWTLTNLETAMREYCELNDLKTGSLFGLLRVTITGRTAAPGLFETMLVLGNEAVEIRLNHAQKRLTV